MNILGTFEVNQTNYANQITIKFSQTCKPSMKLA